MLPDILEFRLSFKVSRKVKTGCLGLNTMKEDVVILNNGKRLPLKLPPSQSTIISAFSERKNRVWHNDSSSRRQVIERETISLPPFINLYHS